MWLATIWLFAPSELPAYLLSSSSSTSQNRGLSVTAHLFVGFSILRKLHWSLILLQTPVEFILTMHNTMLSLLFIIWRLHNTYNISLDHLLVFSSIEMSAQIIKSMKLSIINIQPSDAVAPTLCNTHSRPISYVALRELPYG